MRRPVRSSPTGAEAITVATFKGPQFFQFHDALQNAVTRVFDGLEDAATPAGTPG